MFKIGDNLICIKDPAYGNYIIKNGKKIQIEKGLQLTVSEAGAFYNFKEDERNSSWIAKFIESYFDLEGKRKNETWKEFYDRI